MFGGVMRDQRNIFGAGRQYFRRQHCTPLLQIRAAPDNCPNLSFTEGNRMRSTCGFHRGRLIRRMPLNRSQNPLPSNVLSFLFRTFVLLAFGIISSPAHAQSASFFPLSSELPNVADPNSAVGLPSLPSAAQAPVSTALGQGDSRYWVRAGTSGFQADNPRHSLAVDFTKYGTQVRSRNLTWNIHASSYGYGEDLPALKASAPQANANRVEYRFGSVTEWYVNGPMGLEQGFTLTEPPKKATDQISHQPATIELALSGDLAASLQPGGSTITLSGKNGRAVLRYSGLNAHDATGRELRSWLDLRGKRLLLRVDDSGARYPLVVDPWVQQAELTSSDGGEEDYFGTSVAVSGSTAVVGAWGHAVGSNGNVGAVYVFVQSGSTWTQQAELTAPDGTVDDCFGCSVAVSGDTVVVGASGHTVGSNTAQGAAYVFVQSGSTWSLQSELIAADGGLEDQFGGSVAVSGSTVVIGASLHAFLGAAYVFVQSGSTWNQQAELTASDATSGDYFGLSVAVSGNTTVVGAPYRTVNSNPAPGAAYVFVQSGDTWTQQAELTASDGASGDCFGCSVAVSGGTALIGAPRHTVGSAMQQGAAYVFEQSSNTWGQLAELTASDGAAGDDFGSSVAVSGSIGVVGAENHTVGSVAEQGTAYVFQPSGSAWNQQAELIASDGAVDDEFGAAAAVSGGIVVVGAPDHAVGTTVGQGAAYVFNQGSPTMIATTTTVTSSANPQTLGNNVTFTATVTPASGTGVPTGTVTFTVDGGTGTAETLNGSGEATYSTSSLTAGTHTIVATYSGDTNYSSSSGQIIETITGTGAAATISVVSGSGQTTTYGSAFTSPLVVIVKDANGNPVSGVTVTFSGAGLGFSATTVTTGSNGEASVNASALASGSLIVSATTPGVTGAAKFSLTAIQAVLTITATNATVAFNQPIPAFTYMATGFVNGDTSSVLTGSPSETTTATQGSAPGTYPIAITQGTLTATNYSFRFVNGTLTISAMGTTATPTFSPAAGTYTSAQSATISDITPGAVIYYTTNGTAPTTASPQYNAAITVGATETIEAIAVAPGYLPSTVASADYTINLPPATFTLAASPSSASIASTASATFTLTVTPQNGFVQPISFNCSGLPSSEGCTFSPPSITPSGSAVTSTLTIAPSATAKNGFLLRLGELGGSLAVTLFLWPVRRRRIQLYLAAALLAILSVTAIGCGSGSGSGSGKSTNYSVTVTASGGGVSQTTTISLTVTN
jgi:hypothetical protein